jgi:hypothetical protein
MRYDTVDVPTFSGSMRGTLSRLLHALGSALYTDVTAGWGVTRCIVIDIYLLH